MHQGKINAVSHEGRGIIKVSGKKTVFVDLALLGEEVEYDIYKTHKTFDEAKVTKVLIPSPQRVTPPCPYFGDCGGCALQHMDHDAQIALKQHTLLSQLEHTAQLTPERILPPLLGPVWHYRYKTQLSVCHIDGKVILGFKSSQSHNVVDIKKCLILPEHICLDRMTQLINTLTHPNHVFGLDISIDHNITALIFHHRQTFSTQDLEKIKAFGEEENFQIYTQGENTTSICKIYPKDHNRFLNYDVQGIIINFHPHEFTQINPTINKKMIDQVIELLALKKDDHVLDLYCGIGNFSLPIANHVASVTGIEGIASMVKNAQYNASVNGITNARFFQADLGKNNITWPAVKYSKLILDPPRTGANMKLVIGLKIPYIIYVSCHTATLVRDAQILKQEGYKLVAAGIMDMFPHTKHVESMTLFAKI